MSGRCGPAVDGEVEEGRSHVGYLMEATLLFSMEHGKVSLEPLSS
jgi:hypothetical protein